MIKTIGVRAAYISLLSEAINDVLAANNITADKLIDIKLDSKSDSDKYALIIYKE